MISFFAMPIQHPLGEFYLTSLPVSLLKKCAFSDQLKDLGNRIVGLERKVDPDRVNGIAAYLGRKDSVLPTSIILAANTVPANREVLGDWNSSQDSSEQTDWFVRPLDVKSDKNEGDIVAQPVLLGIPNEDVKNVSIIDGQHRLKGCIRHSAETGEDLLLPCAVFLGLPRPYQASIFATINFNQKPVNKSLTYLLFGCSWEDESPRHWTPDKFAVYMARRLNEDEASSFYGHVKVVGVQRESVLPVTNKWTVSLATVVEGIQSLITSSVKDDRNLMLSRSFVRKTRDDLEVQKSSPPLRTGYVFGDDEMVYCVIKNYFNAVEECFFPGGEFVFLHKTAGVQALFVVLKNYLSKVLSEKHDGGEEVDLRESVFRDLFHTFDKNVFRADPLKFNESSAKGRSAIRDAFLRGLHIG